MNIQIRYANRSDYNAIKQACVKEGWTSFSRPDCEEALDRSLVLCAYSGDEFVGYLRALSDGYITIFVCEILVIREYRRKGIGGKMLEHVHSLHPKARIDLISDQDEFYTAQGFHPIGSGMRKKDF